MWIKYDGYTELSYTRLFRRCFKMNIELTVDVTTSDKSYCLVLVVTNISDSVQGLLYDPAECDSGKLFVVEAVRNQKVVLAEGHRRLKPLERMGKVLWEEVTESNEKKVWAYRIGWGSESGINIGKSNFDIGLEDEIHVWYVLHGTGSNFIKLKRSSDGIISFPFSIDS